jgi:hypothetical protein
VCDQTSGDPDIEKSLTRLRREQGDGLATQHGYDISPQLKEYMAKVMAAARPQ